VSVDPVQLLLYDQTNAFSEELTQDFAARGWTVSFAAPDPDRIPPSVLKGRTDLILMNLKEGPDDSLADWVAALRNVDDNLPLVCLTPNASVEAAVSLMKRGLSDLIRLPAEKEALFSSLQKAVERYRLARKVYGLDKPAGPILSGLIGRSEKMQENFEIMRNVAKSKATVLILGESGTGKELVAKAIHSLSDRNREKFLDLNCGAIPRELLENELFGHERGSYTGADRRYLGSFERAHGGTLFLDEICEMDLALQVKLLRVLQERSFMRIGGSEKVEIDVRVIAATNRDIQEEVRGGRFREDLYYRLNVVPVHVPPLRERRDDIPLLAAHFLKIFASKNDKIFLDFDPEVLEILTNYSWPGNVRELENMTERIVVLNNDSRIRTKHLPPVLKPLARKKMSGSNAAAGAPAGDGGSPLLPLKEMERQLIEQALKEYKGNVPRVAKALGLGQATLYRKIQKFQMKKE